MRRSAFTLVELMVATAITALIILLLVGSMGQVAGIWTRTRAQVSTFQSARAAFEAMTRNLSQATLHPYWRAHNKAGTGAFDFAYVRDSDLHFISGPASASDLLGGSETEHPTDAVFFQAPLGTTVEPSPAHGGRAKFAPLTQLLVACGYWIEWDDGKKGLPPFLAVNWPERWRFRLYEMLEPAEDLSIYHPDKQKTETEWITDALKEKNSDGSYKYARPAGENIVAMVLLPKVAPRDRAVAGRVDDLTKDYRYNTRAAIGGKGTPSADTPRINQLPPVVEVILVAIDETSASRYADTHGKTAPEWTKGLFKKISKPEDIEDDLKTLQQRLIDDKINARVFRSEVVLRASKWSRDAIL